jgi:hypothetical protein
MTILKALIKALNDNNERLEDVEASTPLFDKTKNLSVDELMNTIFHVWTKNNVYYPSYFWIDSAPRNPSLNK